jgi:hypothetical protein
VGLGEANLNFPIHKQGDKLLSKSKPTRSLGDSAQTPPNQPDEPQNEANDDSEPNKSKWQQVTLAIIGAQAAHWFEELNPVPLIEHLAKPLAVSQNTHEMLPLLRGESAKIVPQMRVELDDLGEEVQIPDSELGRAIVAFLDSRGVNYTIETILTINHFQRAEIDAKYELQGRWGTEIGTPFSQLLRIYRDKTGKETAFWHTHLMASTLPIESFDGFSYREDDGSVVRVGHSEQLLEQGAMTTGEWSTRIFLPEFLKRLAFMSETPYPSTSWLTSLSRNIAYPETPPASRPLPTYVIERQAAAEGFARDQSADEGEHIFWNSLHPEVVLFGWRFTADTIPYLEDVMPRIVDGLTAAVSTVEDGYRNYRTDDYPADWDSIVGSPAANYVEFERGVEAHGLPRWVAATELANEHFWTVGLFTQGEEAAHEGLDGVQEDLLLRAVNNGLGPYVAAAVNTLIYSHYAPRLPEKPESMEVIEDLADRSLSLEVWGETTNTMSNMGIAYLMLGSQERAIAAFEAALERADEFAEAEASFFLADIYQRQGNHALAEEYANRAQEAGGYEAPEWYESVASQPKAKKPLLGQSANPAAALPRAKFCTQCGTAFETEDSNFCSSCGTRRA